MKNYSMNDITEKLKPKVSCLQTFIMQYVYVMQAQSQAYVDTPHSKTEKYNGEYAIKVSPRPGKGIVNLMSVLITCVPSFTKLMLFYRVLLSFAAQ